MRRGHLQRTVDPLPRREAVPRVFGKLGGVWAPIEPDRPVRVPEEPRDLIRQELERPRVHKLVHPEVRSGPAHRVRGGMWLRLALSLREDRSIPGPGLQPRRIVDGETGVVPDIRTGHPMGLVFESRTGGPFTRKINLGHGRNGQQQHKGPECQGTRQSTHGVLDRQRQRYKRKTAP